MITSWLIPTCLSYPSSDESYAFGVCKVKSTYAATRRRISLGVPRATETQSCAHRSRQCRTASSSVLPFLAMLRDGRFERARADLGSSGSAGHGGQPANRQGKYQCNGTHIQKFAN